MDERTVKQLITSIKCGSCGKNYDEDHIEVIEHRDELWFLKVSCTQCRLKCLVAAIIRKEGEPEVVTDLTAAELEKFRHADTVSGDDLLDMHDFLKGLNGDFPQFFRNK
jgi:hypothetical protein